MRHFKKIRYFIFPWEKPFKSRGIFCGINHSKMMVILFVFERILSEVIIRPNAARSRFLPIRQKVIWFLTLEFGHFLKTLYSLMTFRILNSRLIFHFRPILSSWNSFKMEECKRCLQRHSHHTHVSTSH